LLKTKEQFIKDAEKIHGDKYNYDDLEYVNSRIKVKIFCNVCKKYFYQNPSSHLQGVGCPFCAIKHVHNIQRKTTEQFIQEAKAVHGNKYNYDQVVYKNAWEKVKIFCKKCEKYFYQTPHDHLKGKGCLYCIGLKKTNEVFIQEAKKIHNNKYDYKNIEYTHNKVKIQIYCKKCKKYFWQSPNDHLSGHGCPNCSKSKGEDFIYKWLTKNNIQFEMQKRFENCKDKLTLPFDFYLPDYNMCIEFQGEQHFTEKKEYFHQKYPFEIQLKHDKIKKDYCNKNKITLLEINYNENIKEKLEKHIKLV